LLDPYSPAGFSHWLHGAEGQKRTDDLQGALLLYSEAAMAIWKQANVTERMILDHAQRIRALHRVLQRLEPRSRVLRAWYLAWEAFRQWYAYPPPPSSLDFLAEALEGFPADAAILLAAGSRSELEW